ncbi:winged helix-turn-helix transcriptional regulator [Natronosalvus rutilus]|uniref:Winged helix-turn-helix transcriptional regulator n=1 Tax=Natronosalvus rutilus TaxID=2953753 RepID=A0A9E7NE14_9EURY|nr:winged helix-turn-helix transcriptional regulator [Natronosalvus rutilus]UTF55611.1 winged helix-turn-helix transcriptional regulator [Natronosalvus rutilus]
MSQPARRSETIFAVLSVLSKKWHPRIILVLRADGPLGFNDLQEHLPGISSKVLTGNLEELRDRGLVDRVVVSESPLRVQYDLTDAGKELDDVFDALVGWGERHFEPDRKTVIVAESDRRLAKLYRQWLAPSYTVRVAVDANDISRHFDDSTPAVVLYDRYVPGAGSHEVTRLVRSLDESCRIVLLTADRLSFDVTDLECDAIVRKPAAREVVRRTVETQFERYGEDPDVRERHALVEKRAALEDVYSATVLKESSEYRRLCERLAADDGDSSVP